MSNARVTVILPCLLVHAIDREQLKKSLSHPHPESLEMAEAGFATWAERLSNDAADLIAPGAGEEVRWTADRGWKVVQA